MDHVVYLDASAKELENLIDRKKSMIIRGAAGRKMPYGRVCPDDVLYFLVNNGEGQVRARAHVKSVLNSDALSNEESVGLIAEHQAQLQLTDKQLKRWNGKRYLVLIEVDQVEEVETFQVDKSGYSNMDDWLPVGDINAVKI
jgi:hypothetical protein